MIKRVKLYCLLFVIFMTGCTKDNPTCDTTSCNTTSHTEYISTSFQNDISNLQMTTSEYMCGFPADLELCDLAQDLISNHEITSAFNSTGVVISYDGFLNEIIEYNPKKNILIFTKKMDDNIISDINIGMSKSKVKYILNDPYLEYENALMYYYDDYSVIFYGEVDIEFIGFIVNDEQNIDYKKLMDDLSRIDDNTNIRDLYLEYGGDMYTSPTGGVQILLISSGVQINSINGDLEINLYTNPDFQWEVTNSESIKIIDEDFDLNSFISFCTIMNSDEWLYNKSQSTSVYIFENINHNSGKFIIRDNDNNFTVVETGYTPIQIEWIKDDVLKFYTSSSLYSEEIMGPFYYNISKDIICQTH